MRRARRNFGSRNRHGERHCQRLPTGCARQQLSLRDGAKISSQIRTDGVVPFRQNAMRFQAKATKLFGSGDIASRVMTTVQVSRDGQSGFGRSGANEIQDFLVAVERFAGPVF